VYDIHSPNIPETREMLELLEKALERIPAQRLWVNPDCGLKTRGWKEVEPALQNMVEAARILREKQAGDVQSAPLIRHSAASAPAGRDGG